jgi:Holliday junction resolvase RusA-like endonuclease
VSDALVASLNFPPLAQPRPRFTARGGKLRAYEPKPAREWKAAVAAEMRKQAAQQGFEMAEAGVGVELDATFWLPAPSTHKGRSIPCVGRRGDIDNFLKAIMDAGNGVLWQDDCQIWKVVAQKRISSVAFDDPRIALLINKTGEV